MEPPAEVISVHVHVHVGHNHKNTATFTVVTKTLICSFGKLDAFLPRGTRDDLPCRNH